MARTTELLTAIKVKNAKAKGLYPDGAGVYLKVTETGSKSWVYRYKRAGKARDMGLGNADVDKVGSISLAEARKLAGDARQKLLDGIDPLDEKQTVKLIATNGGTDTNGNGTKTFKAAAEEMIKAKKSGWRNEKHREQWSTTLTMYVYPLIGSQPVADITTDHVLKVLEQPVEGTRKSHDKRGRFWDVKTETASRVRGRIEAVLSYAKSREWRTGENPARWRDHLVHSLPEPKKVKEIVHHPAMPYEEVPEFMARLRENDSISARALELVILTAARTGEALGAPFCEFDLDGKVWTVPSKRMKAKKEHKVPLPPRAVEIVEEMASIKLSDYAFPGLKSKRPLTDMALTMLLRGMYPGVTTHGFRSTFKNWCLEKTDYPDHLSEAALAHISADKVRGAYARTNLFEKRRKLMNEWAEFCAGCGGVNAEAPAAELEAV